MMPRRHVAAYAVVACLTVAGCRRAAAPVEEAELPTLDVTNWTELTELFMEYPPLVAAETVRFAVHLTRLGDFSAMTAGRPRVELVPDTGGATVTLPGNEPSRPGVFRVEGALPAAGRYRWALVIEAPGLNDRHDLGVVTVFADQASAVADAERQGEGDPEAISYLKEPQWTNGFGTAVVREVEMRRGLRVPATIEPLTGGEAVVSAPRSGRFMTASLPSVGDRVTAGQSLGRLEPRSDVGGEDRTTLVADVDEARVRVEAARAEVGRAERLLAERAVPARRVEEAQRALAVADARLRAAEAHLTQHDETLRTGGGGENNAFALRAPIAGRVAEVMASLGASYDEGAPLFRIVRTDRVELQAHVPASEAPLRERVEEIALEIPGRRDPIVVEADHMHDAGIIDPRTRALPVQFDVDNRSGQLLIGQSATAVLYMGGRQQLVAVPADAVLMEAGRAYVFVQIGGESFVRRYLDVAVRDGNLVGVRSGVTPGERVVIRGAYDVQLASASGGVPAEGHVH